MATEQERRRLVELRSAIDAIDDSIIDILVERFERTREIGLLKRDAGLGPVDPTREQALYDRVRSQAAVRGIDPDAVEALYRTLIAHVVVEHQAIARGEDPAPKQ